MGDRARLFLSSRFNEFQSLRAVVARRLTNAGYEVIGLNDGRAVPMSAAGRSTEEVRNADGLILLNGQTYAEIDDPTYVSPTHQEWQAAVEAEIPVFAYATAAADRDPRLTGMLEDLRAVSVIGDLDGTVEELDDDAERIVNDVDAWASLSDEDTAGGQRRGLYEGIARELDAMGASLTGPTARASVVSHRLRGEIHERATLALQALKAGDRAEARRQVEAALGVYQYDWLSNYVQSRLLEARGWNNDLTAAYTAVCRSLQTVTDEDVAEQLTARRLVILNNLRARLARRRGDFPAALESARASLREDPRSGDALAEAARSSSALGDRGSAVKYAHTLLELYPNRAIPLMRDPLLAHSQPDVERALVARVMERVRQAGAAGSEEVASPGRLRDALDLYRKHVATWRRELREELDLVAEGVLGGSGEEHGVLQQMEDHAHHITLLSRLADQLTADGAEPPASGDMVDLLPSTTVEELGSVAELHAAVRDFEVPGRSKPTAWSAATVALLLAAALAGRPLGTVVGSSLFTLAMLALAVTAGVRAFNQETVTRWPAEGFTENFGGGCFTIFVASVVGYVSTWIVRLIAPHLPAWMFLIAGVLVGVRAAKLLAGRRRSGVALDMRRQELLTARERALASLRLHLADHEGGLVACQHAHQAWTRRVDNAAHHVGRPAHGVDVYGHILHLGGEILAFNRALAVYPNWGFADYVPVARARRGDLTRIDADPTGRHGGLLNGADLRRMVRVVDDTRVSDVAVLGDDVDTLVRLEDALIGALVVRQASRAPAGLQPGSEPGTDPQSAPTHVGSVVEHAPTLTSPA